MPLTIIQKIERNLKNTSTYERAYKQALGGQSVSREPKEFGLSLIDPIQKKREAKAENADQIISMGYISHTGVFFASQEIEM